MLQYQDAFKKFYLAKHNGRRLTWINSLGHCILKSNFPNSRKELQVSLFQTVLLMLFNDPNQTVFSFEELRQRTNFEQNELIKILQSLSIGKVKILLIKSGKEEVTTKDSFEVNNQFKSKQFRLKINSVQMKETVITQQ